MSAPRPHQASRGFTLVEVLVAMFIMAILAVMAWQGVDGIVNTRTASQGKLEQLLRLNTVMAQFEQDLQASQDSRAIPQPMPSFDGLSLRITRRTTGGMQLVVWSLRGGTWLRWAGPAVTTVRALQEQWMNSQQFIGNEPGQLRTITGISEWQAYCYRSNAWSNCQSSAGSAAPDASPASPPSPTNPTTPTADPLRAMRVVLSFAEGSGFSGSVTRDIALEAAMSAPRTKAAHAQRGAALLLAMIIVTLIATLAVSMVWQQWRAVQTETAERARSQSAWILSGALEWAGLILREDKRDFDHPSDIWGTPLAEARLSSFLSVDKDNNTDDTGPEAFLSGSMVDAQSRFNLRNLLDDKFKVSPSDLAAFRRLCENVNVAVSVADVIANGLQQAYAPSGASGGSDDPPLLPKRVSDLAWLGVDEQALRRLEPYIVLLEEQTNVNVNTAEREVIAAVIPGLNVGDAERLVQYRQRSPFKKRDDITAQLPGVSAQNLVRVDVMTRYFEIRGRLRLDDRVLEQRSLVQRSGRVIRVLHSELVNFNDGGR